VSKYECVARHRGDGAFNRRLKFETEDFPMQYLLTLYAEEAGFQRMTKEQQQQGMAAYMAYTEALKQAGAYKGSNRLQPIATATTVRSADGKTQVLDGPYADTKEQLGGYFLIDVPDLDAALSWAARCPGSQHGVIEVRPIWTM
jgi:hypothetical protein